MSDILKELAKPFHPSHIQWLPGAVKGERALALAYADLRAYMTRLDEVCGIDWSVSYEPWGIDRIICRLTIAGSTRSSTGEMGTQDEKNEIGGTVAEAQAFKRACAMFGLGRYLYAFPSSWADIDPRTKQFTDAAKAKLSGMVVQHYRRATEGKDTPVEPIVEPGPITPATDESSERRTPPHNRLWGIGKLVLGKDWDMARPWVIRQWTKNVSPDNIRTSATELSDDEKTLLGDYLNANAATVQKLWPQQKAKMEAAVAQQPQAA